MVEKMGKLLVVQLVIEKAVLKASKWAV